jgi:predicted phosphodiesterase
MRLKLKGRVLSRIAVFSDVHSNLPALQRVLDDIKEEGIGEIYCLGDLVGYDPFPNEVIEIIRKRRIKTVQGNYDEGVGYDGDGCGCAYITEREKETGVISLEWTKAHTSEENKGYLRRLPTRIK